MDYRLIAGMLIFALALLIQFSLGAAGVAVDLVLAALIVFAFFYGWQTLVLFVLSAVFLLNEGIGVTPSILLFAVIPFAVYAVRRVFALAAWAGIPAAIVLGFALLYALIAPYMFTAALPLVAIDIGGGLVFGELAFALLHAAER